MQSALDVADRPGARGAAHGSLWTLIALRRRVMSAAGRRSRHPSAPGVLAMLSIAFGALSGCDGADRTDRPDATASKLASGAESANWNFERGDFAGWRTLSFGSGSWHVYADGTAPPDPADSDPRIVFKVPPPPEGKFGAVTDMRSPGARILHRTLKLDGRFKLRLTLFYESVGEFSSPPNLDFHLEEPNKQFRVELLDAAAPVTSMAAKHVLATIFQTSPGDRASLSPREVTVDLSRWAGQSVRVRLAQVDNRGPLRAGVDNIRLDAIDSQ